MKVSILVLVILIGVGSLSCQQEQETGKLYNAEGSNTYKLCSTDTLPQGLVLGLALDTTDTQGVWLKIELRNTSPDTLMFYGNKTELLVEGKRGYAPLSTLAKTKTLAPGTYQELQWHYQPINDLAVYQKTALPGFFSEEYGLKIAYSSKEKAFTDTLNFCFQPSAYLIYKELSLKKQPAVYEAVADSLQLRAQANYTQNLYGQEGSVNLSENEFFVAGVNMQHKLYKSGNELNLALALVNHSPQPIYFLTEEVYISTDSLTLLPKNLPTADSVVLKKGQRWQGNYAFTMPFTADTVQIQYEGIRHYKENKPWLLNPVTYKLSNFGKSDSANK